MADTTSTDGLLRGSRYDAPNIQASLAWTLAGVFIVALARNALYGEGAPNAFIVLATVISIVALLLIGRNRDPIMTAMRAGFHGGMFGFFLAMPLLGATQAELTLSETTADTVGWSLVLTVIGFEVGYWARRVSTRPTAADRLVCVLTVSQRRWIFNLMWIGLALWLLVLLDYAVAADVPFLDVMLTMRGEVRGARPDAAPSINLYVGGLLASATYMSTACASVLLTVPGPSSRITRLLSWVTLLVCGFVGWLRGSRAMFFYAFAPILTTAWPRLSSSSLSRAARVLVMVGAVGILSAAWGAQSAMRGGDIRRYEDGVEGIAPETYTAGAFDIFAELGPIIESFPSLFPYQYGKSIIPLVLGWVPRPLWPDKPYPFSLYANLIRGETLEERSASIAIGLTGEGYGQGGLLGVLLWSALMGVICRWGDERLGKIPRHHPLRLQLAGICAIWAAMIVRGSPAEMFYMGLYVWGFVWLLVRYLSRKCMVDPERLFAEERVPAKPQAAALSSSSV